MALDISSIQTAARPLVERQARTQLPIKGGKEAAGQLPVSMESALKGLEQAGAIFNRRLSFSLNTKLDSVVVKVIDTDTDKVVREIPPVEVQRCYERLREVIGRLLDEKA
jgi:flagellar protein FlaG